MCTSITTTGSSDWSNGAQNGTRHGLPPSLGGRIFQTVCDEPLEDAIASPGKVAVCLLLADARDPLEALDGFALQVREMLIAAHYSADNLGFTHFSQT